MEYERRVIVTGGAGFIGSAYLNMAVLKYPQYLFLNVDALTPAANLNNVQVTESSNYRFIKADIRELGEIKKIFHEFQPTHILNFAAESHVDISMQIPFLFVGTNIVGTHNLLSLARDFKIQRFLQVSTDEVYGSLEQGELSFKESDPLLPNNPYSATKAAADCLVRSYHHTWELNVVTTRSSNNYGPGQYPNKLIPKFIKLLKAGKPVTIHGTGEHVRDWLFVEDNVHGIDLVFHHGKSGEIYNIGGECERSNLDIGKILVRFANRDEKTSIKSVIDRPGNDKRYALDISKIKKELGWKPKMPFEDGMRRTYEHYQSIFR